MPSVILATAGYDRTIKFWEAPSGTCYRTIQLGSGESQVNCLRITPDKQFIAAGGNPNVNMYDVASNNSNSKKSFIGHKSNVTGLGFENEGKWMYTASEDGTVKIWDVRAPGCQRQFECGAAVNSVTLHPNQAELISGQQNGTVRVWDMNTGQCTKELIPDGEIAIRSVHISPNATTLVAANNTGAAYLWKMDPNSSELEPIQKLQAHNKYLLKVLFSPNSKYLATTSADKTIKVWTLNKGQYTLVKELKGHGKWVWDCVFSVDSAYLVSASSDQTARLWDIGQGGSIRQYSGHAKAVTSVALTDN